MNLKLTFYNFKRQLTYFFLFISTLVFAQSDLVVTKTINNTTPLVGSNVIFTITARNNGTSNNSNVRVNDLLPSGYTYVSNTTSRGTYNSTTGVWTIGNLNNGASATLTITATVKSSGIYTNTATINTSSGISDPNLSNNVASVTPLVQVDSDGDEITNNLDLDDDNDGILDADENTCIASSKVEGTPIFINDFGTGATTSDPYVLNHTYTTGNANDGFYNVRTSGTSGVFYTRTNLTGNKDAGNPTITNGTTTGRYLMINIDSPNNTNKAIYRVTGINTQVGQSYRFRIDMAGLAEGSADIPNLKIAIKDASNNELASANSSSLGMANDDVWRRLNLDFTATTSSVILEIINQQPSGSAGNDVGIDNIILAPLVCDLDGDGIPNSLDLDSDGDGCADAIEGSENVKYNQIHDLNLPLADPNYAYRGQIKVTYNGTTTSTPSGIISNSPSANGVPQLLNNAGNNLNASTNPSNLAGAVDNTDGTADIGQGIGDSQDNTINSCKCYKAPSTDGNNYPTQHGITAFSRAGADNQNWPMVRQSGWTALEASTKGFVINRMPASTTGGNAGEPVDGGTPVITSPIAGMMFYDTTNDCLKINVDGTRSGWKCFNNQSCPDEN